MVSGSQAMRCNPACVAVEICCFRSSIAASISAGVWLWRSLMQEFRGRPWPAYEDSKRSGGPDALHPFAEYCGVAAFCEGKKADTLLGGALLGIRDEIAGRLAN